MVVAQNYPDAPAKFSIASRTESFVILLFGFRHGRIGAGLPIAGWSRWRLVRSQQVLQLRQFLP
ncbi:MAG: hypothetical protein CMA10_04730 [Euryarchaeota archaeon]|nr:hypothetical protein [Euryarchaeota archaeon]